MRAAPYGGTRAAFTSPDLMGEQRLSEPFAPDTVRRAMERYRAVDAHALRRAMETYRASALLAVIFQGAADLDGIPCAMLRGHATNAPKFLRGRSGRPGVIRM